MKAVLLWFATLLLTCAAEAQFYAPPVDFHDAAQRRFPVEAARVLAWLHQGEPAIVEITYQVQTDSNGETVWKLEWKPAAPAGRARTAAVRYPESALRKGADWYRDVWQQLAGADWALPKSGDPALEAAFWQGAEGAGLSRMEGIAAALKQAATTPQPAAADSARLAGTLAQSALPLVDHCLTLDGALLARSAAWLCAAEQQAGARTAAPWAPLLALAGRGPESLAAWSASEEPSGTGAPCWRAWDILIRLPPATVGLPLIAQPENRLLAAPVFFAYVEIDPEYRGLLGDLAPRLFPGDRWTRLYDYGAGFMRENAHRDPLAEDFPARGLRAWLGVLRQLTPAPGDAAEAPALGLAVHDYDREISALRAPSAELAGLLNAAIHQGDGPLVPVAVVTARDLLLYGWESAGLQFGTLHTAFSVLQNGRDKARDLEKNWFGAVEGWAVFTQNLKLPPFAPLPASDRYEFIRSSRVALELIRQPPAGWPKTPDAYGRRRWLSDPHRALDFLLQQGGHAELATRFVRRSIAEGSERNLGDLLTKDNHFMYDVPGNQWQYGRMVDLLKLRGELTRAAPLSVSGPREALRQKYADQKDPLAYAQALERLHWQSGLACAPSTVFV
ncbi:MAG TPA: hypothetical protein VGO11_26380, partial [Chthoniobacteraceae bacterium]|nr:hypothetical protein [Chthoniobacteraceae bacterium]